MRRTACVAATLLVVGCGAGQHTAAPAPAAASPRDPRPSPSLTSRPATPSAPSPPASTPPADAFPGYAVTALGTSVSVAATAGGPEVARLDNPRPSGAPLTFLLDRREGAWLKVFLPTRPNGSEGWVTAAAVAVTGVPYRLDVHLDAHRLDLFAYGQPQKSFPIGVGRAQTPTPGGVFYLAELLRAPDPTGPYGPFAYGLSGHSTTLASFAGADAVIGLHGTNEPAALGHDVSHGCIRLANSDISYLAGLLPLGTTVRILS